MKNCNKTPGDLTFVAPAMPVQSRLLHHAAKRTRLPLLLAVAAMVSPIVAGCDRGPQLPPTYPVQGKAVWKNGKPWNIEGVRITLQLRTDPKVVAVGTIDKNGEFTVTTNMYGKEKPGAAEGEHTAMVEPPAPPGEVLPQIIRPYVVEEPVQIKPVDENPIKIEVEKL